MENVNWEEAQEFCQKLSTRTRRKVELPSEAQWEYACRAKTATAFSHGPESDPDKFNYNESCAYGNTHYGQFRPETSPIGSFPPNAWGLFDMHGNVWEWCRDGYEEDFYARSFPKDPLCLMDEPYRVLRGGSWNYPPLFARSAARFWLPKERKNNETGFRVVVAQD